MDGISVDSISKVGSIGAAVSWKESQSIFIFKKKAEVEEPFKGPCGPHSLKGPFWPHPFKGPFWSL